MRCFAFTYYVILFYARCALVSHTHFILCWDIHVVYNHIFCVEYFSASLYSFLLKSSTTSRFIFSFIISSGVQVSLDSPLLTIFCTPTTQISAKTKKRQAVLAFKIVQFAVCSLCDDDDAHARARGGKEGVRRRESRKLEIET